MDFSNEQTIGEISRQIAKMEAHVESGFSSIERQLSDFDSKYARNDAVMALHAKTSDIIKTVAKLEVEHTRDIGDIKSEVKYLSGQFKIWLVGVGIVLSIVNILVNRL